jgi:hypothetical protein
MFRHTFRGARLKTFLGLESERDAFKRYKAIRRAEREFFPEPILASSSISAVAPAVQAP